MFVAQTLETIATVSVLGREQEVPYSSLADGCVGVLPVFDTVENLKAAYSGDVGWLEIEKKQSPPVGCKVSKRREKHEESYNETNDSYRSEA